MENNVTYKKQAVSELDGVLAQNGMFSPVDRIQNYELSLSVFLENSDSIEKLDFLNYATHNIYTKKSRSALLWVNDVEKLTYDLFADAISREKIEE